MKALVRLQLQWSRVALVRVVQSREIVALKNIETQSIFHQKQTLLWIIQTINEY